MHDRHVKGNRPTEYRIRAQWIDLHENLFDERFQSSSSAAVSDLMGEVWNEYFSWREGVMLQLLALQRSPRRWVLRETIG